MNIQTAYQKTRMYLGNIGDRVNYTFSKANNLSLKLMATAGILAYCAEACANPGINYAEQHRNPSDLDLIIAGSSLAFLSGSSEFFETRKLKICGTVAGAIGLIYSIIK